MTPDSDVLPPWVVRALFAAGFAGGIAVSYYLAIVGRELRFLHRLVHNA